MKTFGSILAMIAATTASALPTQSLSREAASDVPPGASIGRHEVRTAPLPEGLVLRSATYTPSGKILVSYALNTAEGHRQVHLATMDDNGQNLRPFFSQALPERPKDNGIRYMVFPDNKRIFLGDFVIECTTSLETCDQPKLLPVAYPAQVADGNDIGHRWSEMIVAPDNRHVAWTTLLANYSALVFTAELRRSDAGYAMADARIVSTLDPFLKDPRHADGVLPQLVRGGEVKQFVHGGAAISMAGGIRRDIADSVVHSLASGRMETITQTPGYDETTIFSPDERLGVVMSARFSSASDMAILGLLPRPYPDSLNMGLNMLAYTHAVTGVRESRPGNVGPALIDIAASKKRPDYVGINLNTQPDWVYSSPMSWHPSSKKAMWIERTRAGDREERAARIQIVELPDYKAGPTVSARPTPSAIAGAIADLSTVKSYAAKSKDVDVKVYGRRSGHITYRRTPDGLIEKTYVDFSDQKGAVYSGKETMHADPRGRSVYTADITLRGVKPGVMKLTLTFGPLGGPRPAELIFAPDASGQPASHGYSEYGDRRITTEGLAP